MKAIGMITIFLSIILLRLNHGLIRNLLFWIGLVKEHLEMSLRFDNITNFHNFYLTNLRCYHTLYMRNYTYEQIKPI